MLASVFGMLGIGSIESASNASEEPMTPLGPTVTKGKNSLPNSRFETLLARFTESYYEVKMPGLRTECSTAAEAEKVAAARITFLVAVRCPAQINALR